MGYDLQGEYCIAIGCHKRTWPRPEGRRDAFFVAQGHPAFQEGAEDTITLVTSLWHSKMMSEAFWNDESVARKSDNFFHSIDHFRSHSPIVATDYANRNRPPPKLVQRELLEARGQLSDAEVDMIKDFESRERQWNEARADWYIPLREKWHNSPWGIPEARTAYGNFVEEFRRNPPRYNQALCVSQARILAYAIRWSEGRDEYVNEIKASRQAWVWHAVGLLMFASMKMRQLTVTHDKPNTVVTHKGTPSQQNPSKGTREWGHSYRIPGIDRPHLVVQSIYYDPLGGSGQAVPFGSFNQMDYLNLVLKVLIYVTEHEIPVSKPWVDEIMRVEEDIRQQRRLQQEQGIDLRMFPVNSWTFKIPVYDSTLHYYSSELGDWQEIPQ
ncbi:hypothetical protein F5Y03DRAFT_20472 [Xylaria venustula]|nr:hypothetical protein F5Y03DRAFT_20472 [Xylaria venustula]